MVIKTMEYYSELENKCKRHGRVSKCILLLEMSWSKRLHIVKDSTKYDFLGNTNYETVNRSVPGLGTR